MVVEKVLIGFDNVVFYMKNNKRQIFNIIQKGYFIRVDVNVIWVCDFLMM